MRLEDLRVDLRPRTPPQAIDLGFELLRRHAGRAWGAWALAWGGLLVLTAPLAWLPGGALWSPFLLWWIRPLPERIVVAILARGTFGQEPSTLDAFRGVWRDGLRGIGRFLTFGRPLGVGRCLRQPVWQLEGASADVSRRRAAQLAAGGAGRSASAWGVACAHFETALTFGLLGLAGLFAGDAGIANPFAVLVGLFEEGEASNAAGIAYWFSYGIAAGLVGPLYAGGGFSLYLARRSELEAWDIEIALRRLMRRIRRPSGAIFLVAILLAGLAPAPAQAAKCPDSLSMRARQVERARTTDPDRIALRRSVDSIHLAEDVRPWECRRAWVPIASKSDRRASWEMPEFLRAWSRLLAASAPYLQWIAIAAFFGSLAYLIWRYRGSFLPDSPTPFQELTTTEASRRHDGSGLPADVAAAARSSWNSGDRRGALSLLYRATIDRLDRAERLALAQGTTEGTLLRRLAGRNGPADSAARDIVRAWASAAWAGRWPDDDGFDRLVSRWRCDLEAGA